MTPRKLSSSLYEPRVNNISKYSRLHQLIQSTVKQMSTVLADIELALTHLSVRLKGSQMVLFADRIHHENFLPATLGWKEKNPSS